MKSYTLPLNKAEFNALAWIAARYESADIIYDALEYPLDYEEEKDPWDLGYPEVEIKWTFNYEEVIEEYILALQEENGNPDQMLPPCAGGTLANKLLKLYFHYYTES